MKLNFLDISKCQEDTLVSVTMAALTSLTALFITVVRAVVLAVTLPAAVDTPSCVTLELTSAACGGVCNKGADMI